MGFRSAVADRVIRAAKAFGGNEPPSFSAGEQAAGMTPSSPFGPGQPIGPYDGYDRTPRSHEFVTGYNIATRPRTHERVSFDVLRSLIDNYDVAQICCVPGTEVITKRGVIPIEDVVVGDEVVTHLGRWRRVTETMVNRPHSPVRTMKSSAFEDLSVTGNHPVYAVDYRMTQTNKRVAQGIGWARADELRPRGMRDGSRRFDGLVLPALQFPDGYPVLDVAAASGGDFYDDGTGLLRRWHGTGRMTRVPARVRMDAAFGRLLGWYMAEGSQGHGRDVYFSLGPEERPYAEQIAADAEAVFGLPATISETQMGNGWRVAVHSSVLASLFSCGTARTKHLPGWAWSGGREFFVALLECWALGDGCRSTRNERESPRVQVVTTSRDLAWQMRMVAIALGLSASIVTSRERDKYKAVIRGRRIASNPVCYVVTWREKPQRWGRESFEFDGRYLATALVSAEQSEYDGPVYNLEVEEDESYVTTGGTVHNCIWHKIDTLRGVRWKLLAADSYNGDVTGAIQLGMKVMRRPDGIHNFKTWFGKWFYDVLAYDAAPLYRMRNRGGQVVGLMPFDGTTLAPLLDYWGNPPPSPAEAYVQYVNGLPWNWLTRDDVIYEPFRAVNNSPYGKAPIETIILNANTDIRFQLYFLQRFTDGNIPEAFASAPETWTPDDIERFQGLWDSMMYGDQAMKHQIRWMPGGSGITWSNEKDFTDPFSLFLMRKSCASYHVVPTDLGFTETSNYSSGESQADVQHKVGELPSMEYAEEIFSRFLYDDLQLPIKFEWDRGEDQDDRLVQAQADQIYIEEGVVGPSEIREMRFGLPEPEGQTVPRFIMTTRAGPVPLSSLFGVAGQIDAATGAPKPGTQLPREVFLEVPGVVPNPPATEVPLAEQEYGPSAVPPAPPMQAIGVPVATDPNAPKVAKEAAGGAPAAGITAETGVYGYDGPGSNDEDEEDKVALAKSELAAFRRFRQARRRAGAWRDFTFEAVDPVRAHNLNDAGRLAVRKDAGEIAVAGLAVLAADTGRVLMLQRALCDDDPAAGTWEFPGGHLEQDESPLAAAWREWQEETGSACAPGVQTGSWTASNGIYQGIVWTIECEAMVPVRSETVIANPDDPDGDQCEAIAWWTPSDLPGNPVVRPELLADIDVVMAALGCTPDSECCGADCCSGGCCDGSGGCMCGPAEVAKAGDDGPKALAASSGRAGG